MSYKDIANHNHYLACEVQIIFPFNNLKTSLLRMGMKQPKTADCYIDGLVITPLSFLICRLTIFLDKSCAFKFTFYFHVFSLSHCVKSVVNYTKL